jgi:hypothetical protein
MTWAQTASSVTEMRVVYEFLSVHVLWVSNPYDSSPECRHQFINLVISYIGCFKSSHGRELSCVRIHRCGAEIIGNYALLLDTAILRDKLELISINNPPPLRVGVNNSSQRKL